jgi:CheY-like chemotaxis protein/anti-sigma regulatory factor (Ser/Thr protein kinase)
MHLNETECNLSELMHEIRNIIQADIKAKHLDLYIDTVDVFDENVLCDKLRLNQILLNILGNALKFTNPGGCISIRITEKDGASKDTPDYEIRVKDTGIGMSPDFVKHIFEPFEREGGNASGTVQGTGLGMSITKNIVDMMGGTIEVYSKKGEGSEFIVTLPLTKLDYEHEDIKVGELVGARALVVDDDFNTCDSVTQMLIQIGMRAEWSLSGREAILRTKQAVRRKDEYKVYIIDWLMPDMNGVEVARGIRAEVGDNVPIIVLTAYDWSDIEDEAKAAGVTAFCSKPLFISDLRRCLMYTLHPEQRKKKTAPPKIEFAGKRILLTEDNALNREIATEILTEHGFEVIEAENGEAAVEKVRASEPGDIDAVLMDIQMPVMDGYDAARAIRELKSKKLSRVPIIAMTANAFEEDRQRALESGMDGYISKPIDIPKLLEMLEEIG